MRIRLVFAILDDMFPMPSSSLHDFVIRCKACGENIAAPVQTMPGSWIVARCPLCGTERRYLPNEIFRGRLSWRLSKKPVRSAGKADAWGR